MSCFYRGFTVIKRKDFFMARVDIREGVSWEQARDELAAKGIILTHRMHRKGGYVCKASKALRESMELLDALNELL